MKRFFKLLIGRAIQVNWIWSLFSRSLIPLVSYAQNSRNSSAQKDQASGKNFALFKSTLEDKTVLNGVFSGMKYPEMNSIGSTLYPKILGSYEKELEPIMEAICRTQYSEIVDIGCAEGYYAVGLAMRVPTAKVFAFDSNSEAIRLCESMARLNNVANRVITGTFCDSEVLVNLPLSERALIISDCEGYEKQLFTEDILPALSRHELLIELHDFIDMEISTHIRKLFEPTHEIEAISSLDDIQKAHQYEYKELEGLSLEQRRRVLSEARPHIMEWFYLKPK